MSSAAKSQLVVSAICPAQPPSPQQGQSARGQHAQVGKSVRQVVEVLGGRAAGPTTVFRVLFGQS